MTTFSAALLALRAPAASARPAVTERHDARPESMLWIEGGSNVHDWSCKAATFEAHIDVDAMRASGEEPLVDAGQVRRIGVKVDVRNLKCGNRRMESDLYRALKADNPSTPSYIVGVFDALRAPETHGRHVDTQGTVAVAGVERSVRLRIAMDHLADGTVVARGNVPLRMTDFGVAPPTGLFGLIRCRNLIVVNFEIMIATRLVAAIK